MRGPKRVACEGRETITVPAHTRCASKLKKNRAGASRNAIVCDFVERNERGRIVCVSAKPLRRALTARASSPESGSSVPALPAGTQGLRGARARRVALPGGCEIRVREHTPGATHYSLSCGTEDDLADLYVEHTTEHAALKRRGPDKKRRPVRVVFDVMSSQPRKGYATRLYEQAAKDACAAGQRLISTTRLASSHSNDFWAKQRKKKRATKIGYVNGQDALAITCGKEADLSGVRARAGAPKCEVLSMPQGSITYYWMNCEYPNGEEDVVAEMYVERAKPTKNACPPGGSRRCAKAITSLPNIRTVDSIDTHGENKRKGYGTKLYQAAARDACAAGEPLVSYLRLPQSESNHFWKKQFEKGRAVSVGEYRDSKTGEKKPIFALQCGRHEDLSGVKRKYKAKAMK